jgi:flagellar motility protein MotE (MotC chaperone)/sporulation protein YlmC with PRC-barrel domain
MTGGPNRVFLRRLIGVEVFEPNGDPLGRVRDVVISMRARRLPPRVLGFVVEVPGKRRIFLPMSRVTDFDARHVVSTGTVNLRRFQMRPTERLVAEQILNRPMSSDGQPVGTAVDVAMDRTRTKDWDLSLVHVRRGGRGLRRGEAVDLEIGAIDGMTLNEAAADTESLLASYATLKPADVATALHQLNPQRRSVLAQALDDERLADVLQEMPDDDRVSILQALNEDRAADVLEAMDPDDAADLLGDLQPESAAHFLSLMQPEEAADVQRLLVYDDATAGGMMTSEPIVLGPDGTVADALAHIRNIDITPSLASQVYVCRPPTETPTGRYLGTAHFQRLLREPPATLVSGVLDERLEPIGPEATLPEVTRYFATYNLAAAPVVDEHNHLLGAVTVDDVIDHMLPEDWRERPVDGATA